MALPQGTPPVVPLTNLLNILYAYRHRNLSQTLRGSLYIEAEGAFFTCRGSMPETVEKICVYCNSPFMASGRQLVGRVKIYCSTRCRQHSSIKRLHPEKLILKSKVCPECGSTFKTYRGYQAFCSSRCHHRTYLRTWETPNKEAAQRSAKNTKLKAAFGIDLTKYNEMLQSQHSKCQICQRYNVHKRALAVDHDWNTGNIRGLLCASCNSKLGWFERRRNSILNYLECANAAAIG